MIFTFLIVFFLIFAEIALALLRPQPYVYSRLGYSEKYIKFPFANVTIEHCVPPNKRYYTTNEYGLRGPAISPGKAFKLPNIVLLGDSYTFGMGVNDGREFASILRDELALHYNVINCGVGGWGLTQQIRYYYEFASQYDPKIIFLLFHVNDPLDNMQDCVTIVKNGGFRFIDYSKTSHSRIYRWSRLLSKSIIQKSNLYNALRFLYYNRHQKKAVTDNEQTVLATPSMQKQDIPIHEKYYIDLLTLFAQDITSQGKQLFIASVNYLEGGNIESWMTLFPHIYEGTLALERSHLLDYIDINAWFAPPDLVFSPVGHYDTQWHQKMGVNLAHYILNSRTR